MRRGRGTVALLWFALTAGCAAPETGRPSSWLESFRSSQGLLGPDVVQLDLALLERPVADEFLDKEIWKFTVEQLVDDMDRKRGVDQNGYRVGLIVGMPPSTFHNLLQSERSCLNPRRRIVASAKAVTQVLGAPVAQCRFEVYQSGSPVEVSLDNAEFVLDVVPFLTEDGIRLRFTPKVQYGEMTKEIRPAPDRSGFTMQMEKPHRTFADLNWEVTLAPNDFLIVGARLDRPDSLGYQSFVPEGVSPAVQRLLVIRTARAAPGLDESTGLSHEDMARASKSPPLALQATLSGR
jgi:hypothetical protein